MISGGSVVGKLVVLVFGIQGLHTSWYLHNPVVLLCPIVTDSI